MARINEESIQALFHEPRTVQSFSNQEVTDQELRDIYEITRMGATAFNSQPLRITWVHSAEARERLVPFMSEGNQARVSSAPVTAILSVDKKWHKRFAEFAPQAAALESMFDSQTELRASTGMNNANMQAGYFLTAVRALGLDSGPMSGADFTAIEKEFFADKDQTPFLVVNIGHGGETSYPRGVRFDFEDATSTL